MQIVHVEAHPLKIQASHSYLGPTALGQVEAGYHVRPPWRSLYSNRYETVLIEVRDADGHTGWGEALAPVGPEVVAAIVDTMLGPYLTGREISGPRGAWFSLRDLMRERGHLVGHQADALAGVDMALWDLFGQLTGLPVCELAGGAVRNSIPLYVSGLPSPDREGRRDMARQLHAEGARRLKLHLGFGIDTDLEAVDSILDLGLGLQIAVDAHWAYTYAEAVALARELASRHCWFLEAPMAPEDLEAHERLSQVSEIPLAVGETLRTRHEAQRWASRAVSILQPDVARTGLSEALAMTEIASSVHARTSPHHSVCSGVAFAAGLHLSSLAPDLLAFEYQPYPLSALAHLLEEPLPYHPGEMTVPTGPGLGIKVNHEVVKELCPRC